MTLDWLVGVALSVVGNVLVSLGTNVLKLGQNKRLQMPLPHPAYKDRFWQAGLAMYGVGNVAMFYAFGYAAQSILAAIGCIQFCSNVLFAWLVLKETVTRQILTATGLIVVGCVLLVAFGSNSSNLLTVQQLLDLYKNHAYIAYLVVGGAVAAASFLLHCLGSRIVSSRRSKRLSLWAAILPVLYSLFSALVGTQSLIFNKAVMVLWRLTLAGDNQFDKWVTWLMAVGFLVTAALWVVQLNKGLQRFPALIIVPCMQLCWTLFGVISGLLYFKEYVGMSGLQVAMFVLGVVVVCMGAGTLAHASQGDMAGLHPADSELNEQEWTAAGKAAHAHAAAPVTELQVAQDSADVKLRVVWSGTDSDQVLVAHLPCASDRGHEQGSALESLGSAPLLPSSGSLPPLSAAQRAQPNLPSHGSLDASGLVPGIGTRRDHRRMSRLRTCSMPLHDYVPKR